MSPFDTLKEVRRRASEAVLAQSGIDHEGLRRTLRAILMSSTPGEGAILHQPVIEAAHPFVATTETMSDLAGPLLHPQLVEAMADLPPKHDYHVPLERQPYRHQVEAWRHLLADDTPRSVLVTSGTGSGKTECFLYPILSDLVARTGGRLEGVEALMLYPLNALIESQRERLSAWTKPFGGRIRYCLYNGNLPQDVKAFEKREKPEEVLDRKELRASPPPILVTNITMLEYMLARADDQPILERSRGKLKWIVLDEAHSLIGAAAAEVALLLRRVLLAFGVEASDVRFVATSATIGDGETEPLRRFLADIAGVTETSVHVVVGARQAPRRGAAPEKPVDLASADPAALYDMLSSDVDVWELVDKLQRGSVPLTEFSAVAARFGVSPETLALKLSAARRSFGKEEPEPLAPLRIHGFERAVPGFWSCINPACPGATSDWEFGRILHQRADHCPDCTAPVLELVNCSSCGTPYLNGEIVHDRLTGISQVVLHDEFAADAGVEADEAEDNDAPPPQQDLRHRVLLSSRPTACARPFHLRRTGWEVVDVPGGETLTILAERDEGVEACPHCTPEGRKQPLIRPLRFGAPFLVANAAPILLAGVAAGNSAKPLPSDGRRLLSFTDSRQGTARLSAKMQVEAERNFVRSYVYHAVQRSMQAAPADEIAAKKAEDNIRNYESILSDSTRAVIAPLIASERETLRKLRGGSVDGIAWTTMCDWLAQRPELAESIHSVWEGRGGAVFNDPTQLAHLMLVREFARRPRRANSVETLGLARLRYPTLERLGMRLPDPFARRRRTLADWQSYLSVLATHFARGNTAVDMSVPVRHWAGIRGQRSLVGPAAETTSPFHVSWPNGTTRASARSRPVGYLIAGLKLDLSNSGDRDDLVECLEFAWQELRATFSASPDRNQLDLTKCWIAPVTEAFICPATRRILDAAAFGLTPYARGSGPTMALVADPVTMPRHPQPFLGAEGPEAARRATLDWLKKDETVALLRDLGMWTDISDRIALFADYARSAEHSAQQDRGTLRRYESAFREGEVNILNCSTTMEMGVDIGSVEAVMMTNVPPSIANYRQRVGRAGRRGQATALAFTFCKDRPLDRDAFRNPVAFLGRSMAAPKVTLSSRPIVQRHVNAYLLSAFLRERGGNALSMRIGDFFGCPAEVTVARPLVPDRPSRQFVEWLGRKSVADAHARAIAHLVHRSVADGDTLLVADTCAAIERVAEWFENEWGGIAALAREESASAASRRMRAELKRLSSDFLLSGLADRGFFPGHGFPTNVVTFLPNQPMAENEVDGARQRRATGPQRSLDLAIRDYARARKLCSTGWSTAPRV